MAYAATYKVEPVYVNFITSDCENPDVAFALLDYMTSTHSTLTARYGREGEYWRYVTEEEAARGSGWADLGYTEALYPLLDWTFAGASRPTKSGTSPASPGNRRDSPR